MITRDRALCKLAYVVLQNEDCVAQFTIVRYPRMLHLE